MLTNDELIQHVVNTKCAFWFDLAASLNSTKRADHYTVTINGTVHPFHVPTTHALSGHFQKECFV